MTFEQYLQAIPKHEPPKMAGASYSDYLIHRGQYTHAHPGQRPGQAAFNALWNISPALADYIRGTQTDPFYNDQRINNFLEYVASKLPLS